MGTTHERIGDSDADDGSDQGVGTGCGKSEIPRADIPKDRRDEERKDHGKSGRRSDMNHEFRGQEIHDTEGHGTCRGEHPEKVKESRPDHRRNSGEGVRINHGGHRIGRVVEAVDELKAQREDQGQQEQRQRSRRDGKEFSKKMMHHLFCSVFRSFCAEGSASEYVTIS